MAAVNMLTIINTAMLIAIFLVFMLFVSSWVLDASERVLISKTLLLHVDVGVLISVGFASLKTYAFMSSNVGPVSSWQYD
jgi:hypothetical protein